jgi:NADH-quinone oxidoreductase subunit A
MPANYHELYFPVLLQVVIAVALAVGLVGGGLLLGKRVRNEAKDTPYESGMQPVGSARERFSVKFYLVAMVFILFDIEAIFLYPWAVVYRELKLFAFVEMLLFIVLVLAGFFYIWKKGVLDWSQEAMNAFRDSETTGLGAVQTEPESRSELVGSGRSDQA